MLPIVLTEYFQKSCVPRGNLKTADTLYLYQFLTTIFFHWNWDWNNIISSFMQITVKSEAPFLAGVLPLLQIFALPLVRGQKDSSEV